MKRRTVRAIVVAVAVLALGIGIGADNGTPANKLAVILFAADFFFSFGFAVGSFCYD